jgi:hypothetical protein
MSAHHDLGRRRGVWIPVTEVEAHLANGWSIADLTPDRGAVLMAPPANEEDMAA